MAALRLKHYLSHAAKRGFQWGEHDCILFAAGWAREVCGRDPAEGHRGQYRDAAAAAAYLKACGGMETAIAQALAVCGWHAIQPEHAKPGDIVLCPNVDHEGSEAVGIAVDRGRAALLTRRGLVVAPHPILKAWRYHG